MTNNLTPSTIPISQKTFTFWFDTVNENLKLAIKDPETSFILIENSSLSCDNTILLTFVV